MSKREDPQPMTNSAGLPTSFDVVKDDESGTVWVHIKDPRAQRLRYGGTKADVLHQLAELVKQVKEL